MSCENLPLAGKLLGHRGHRTTAGYAHLVDEHLVEAAEKVGNIIAEAMGCRAAPAEKKESGEPDRPHGSLFYGFFPGAG